MDKTFQKMMEQENQFLRTNFFAPVFSRKVRIRINGVVVDFKVDPLDYNGWGVFQVTGKNKVARFLRDASLMEIGAYLENYERTSFIVCDNDRLPLGISASKDGFFTVSATPFFLANNVDLFDTVYVRHDGNNFIYERKVNRCARNSQILRNHLANKVEPNKLDTFGLSKFERIAYNFVYELQKAKAAQSTEGRLKSAVQRGGGKYNSYRRVSGNIVVSYEIEGEVFTSTVSESLSVVSAGICLSGTDTQHDLQTLMTVIKEGKERGLIYRF